MTTEHTPPLKVALTDWLGELMARLRKEGHASEKDDLPTAVNWCMDYIVMLQDDLERAENVSGYKEYMAKMTGKGARYNFPGYLRALRIADAERAK